MTADAPMHPGDVWREIIEGAGVTQSWVAGQMGISPKHLNQIVNRRRPPSPEHTVAFAYVMNADPVRIYCAQAEWEIGRAIANFRPRKAGEVQPPGRWARR